MQACIEIYEALANSDQLQLLIKIILSFFVGALIGLEREKARSSLLKEEGEAGIPPGVRSFGFISMLGSFVITIPPMVSVLGYEEFKIVSILLAFFAVTLILLYEIYRLFVIKDSGVTTPIALMLSFTLGLLIGLGRFIEAIAASVFITFMLAIKLRIEALIKFITYEEFLSALEIGIIVFLFGPFFVKDVYDPIFHVINFKTLYVFFVVILIFSYMGYFLVKIKGPQAIQYFSFFGGLVNSEAAVVSIVRLVNSMNLHENIAVGNIITATTAMVFRNIVLTLIMVLMTIGAGSASIHAFMVFVASYMASALAGYFLIKLSIVSVAIEPGKFKVLTLEKPISYSIALKALLVFVAMLIATTYITLSFGELGVLFSSIFGGLVSAEALIFTVFSLVSVGKITINTALASALLATGSAILNKLLFAHAAGAKKVILKKIIWQLLIIALPVELAGAYIAVM
ncbi:MAG: MgtC/SapB family protein [Thermoprotei archaeon]|nr:MgtC/SapB family protein [Thermoprotei archaeon]